MSRAFTREQDDTNSPADVGERPVSQHRNLVTRKGLETIEHNVAELREALAHAEAEGDRERIALVSRDLRYWSARRETAELSLPDPDEAVIRFGMTVTLRDDQDVDHVWSIVGEDEADAASGSISHVSPMAVALFGRTAGDVVTVNGREWEILAVSMPQ